MAKCWPYQPVCDRQAALMGANQIGRWPKSFTADNAPALYCPL